MANKIELKDIMIPEIEAIKDKAIAEAFKEITILTPEEREIIKAAHSIWENYSKLPVQKAGELTEMLQHIRAIQNIVLARETQRINLELLPFIR